MRHILFSMSLALITLLSACSDSVDARSEKVDLLLTDATLWKGDGAPTQRGWIAITKNRIADIGDATQPPPESDVSMSLNSRLVVPGFNDSHVHFAQAGALLLGVNLLDANDEATFRTRIVEASNRLPKGSWITGGDWGAYAAWGKGSEGGGPREDILLPHRDMIDHVTREFPVLVTRYDRKQGLANELALQALGLDSATGVLEGETLKDALRRIPEKSFERKLSEARRALEECRKWGVTTVQDMSPLDRLDVYEKLREDGELTCRIHFSPSKLSDVPMMVEREWVMKAKTDSDSIRPAGDEWISFGTIKTHIDGIMGARSARFFEPYDDNPPDKADWRGGWREFSGDLTEFKRMVKEADSALVQPRVHAIGDEANAILLDMLEEIENANGPRDRRFRLVHAQVIRPSDFPRFEGRGVVAEVQPYHCTDDMRWMEERIGTERCKGAYAFRSLLESGAILSFGSDWPGTNASYYPVNPLLGLYAAVTRQTIEGLPEEGWFPEQRLSLEESLKAYTFGAAYSSFQEEDKGTLEVGKLADIVVLDCNLFETSPAEWLDAKVNLTIVDGKIVFDRRTPN